MSAPDPRPPSTSQDEALQDALRRDRVDLARVALREGASANLFVSYGEPSAHPITAVMKAAISCSAEMFDLLLESNPPLDWTNPDSGFGVMHFAACNARHAERIIDRLHAKGIHVDQAGPPWAWTPLSLCATGGHYVGARALISRGANYLHRDSQGRSIEDLAKAYGSHAVADLIRSCIDHDLMVQHEPSVNTHPDKGALCL